MATDTIAFLLNAKQSQEIFPNPIDIKREYQQLAKLCHPDLVKHPDAELAMRRLVEFKEIALLKVKENAWGSVEFKDPSYQDDSGPVFKYGDKIFVTGNEAVLKQSLLTWQKLISPSLAQPKAVEHFARYIPENVTLTKIWVKDTVCVALQITLPQGAALLGGTKVKRNFPNGLPQHHVAWILSRIYEYIGWLHSLGLSHNGVNPMSLYIVPETHAVIFPTFYHLTELNSRLNTISAKYKNWYPSTVLGTKTAISVIDLELAQQTALSILDSNAKPELVAFLKTLHTDLIGTYPVYRQLLEKLYGPPKFHKLTLE